MGIDLQQCHRLLFVLVLAVQPHSTGQDYPFSVISVILPVEILRKPVGHRRRIDRCLPFYIVSFWLESLVVNLPLARFDFLGAGHLPTAHVGLAVV